MEVINSIAISPKAKAGIVLVGGITIATIVGKCIKTTILELSNKGFNKFTVKYRNLEFEASK